MGIFLGIKNQGWFNISDDRLRFKTVKPSMNSKVATPMTFQIDLSGSFRWDVFFGYKKSRLA